MERPLSDIRPIGPFIFYSSGQTCKAIEQKVSEVANVKASSANRGECIIDFKLDIEPERELASSLITEGMTVQNLVLRYPVLSEDIECYTVDLIPTGFANMKNSHATRDGNCNPHTQLRQRGMHVDGAIKFIRESTELYKSEYPREVRVSESYMY